MNVKSRTSRGHGGGRLDRVDRYVGRLTLALLFVVAGIGLARLIPNAPDGDLIGQARALELMAQPGTASDGDYSFFTNRRYLWIVKLSTGQAQFFHLPESDVSEQPLVKTRVYQVEDDNFPLDQIRYQVSERNLELFLWIMNPTSGKARFIRARRDGGFDESPTVDTGDF